MDKSNWIIVGASTTGKGHIKNEMLCQDAHSFELIDKSCGIAVVSDGAGSLKNSHLGSGFVVENILDQMKTVLKENPLLQIDFLTEEEWRNCMLDQIKILRTNLQDFAIVEELDYCSLGCTLILLLFSSNRLLICHIGDGRAGYSDHDGNWKSLFNPFKGEQVGQTVFITSELLDENEALIETNIVNDNISSFTLLSDGCELACWKCYDKYLDKEQYYDPNEPFPGFLDPCIEALKSMYFDNLPNDEIKSKWSSFLENGNEVFRKETDDKTMIIGTLIEE